MAGLVDSYREIGLSRALKQILKERWLREMRETDPNVQEESFSLEKVNPTADEILQAQKAARAKTLTEPDPKTITKYIQEQVPDYAFNWKDTEEIERRRARNARAKDAIDRTETENLLTTARFHNTIGQRRSARYDKAILCYALYILKDDEGVQQRLAELEELSSTVPASEEFTNKYRELSELCIEHAYNHVDETIESMRKCSDPDYLLDHWDELRYRNTLYGEIENITGKDSYCSWGPERREEILKKTNETLNHSMALNDSIALMASNLYPVVDTDQLLRKDGGTLTSLAAYKAGTTDVPGSVFSEMISLQGSIANRRRTCIDRHFNDAHLQLDDCLVRTVDGRMVDKYELDALLEKGQSVYVLPKNQPESEPILMTPDGDNEAVINGEAAALNMPEPVEPVKPGRGAYFRDWFLKLFGGRSEDVMRYEQAKKRCDLDRERYEAQQFTKAHLGELTSSAKLAQVRDEMYRDAENMTPAEYRVKMNEEARRKAEEERIRKAQEAANAARNASRKEANARSAQLQSCIDNPDIPLQERRKIRNLVDVLKSARGNNREQMGERSAVETAADAVTIFQVESLILEDMLPGSGKGISPMLREFITVTAESYARRSEQIKAIFDNKCKALAENENFRSACANITPEELDTITTIAVDLKTARALQDLTNRTLGAGSAPQAGRVNSNTVQLESDVMSK